MRREAFPSSGRMLQPGVLSAVASRSGRQPDVAGMKVRAWRTVAPPAVIVSLAELAATFSHGDGLQTGSLVWRGGGRVSCDTTLGLRGTCALQGPSWRRSPLEVRLLQGCRQRRASIITSADQTGHLTSGELVVTLIPSEAAPTKLHAVPQTDICIVEALGEANHLPFDAVTVLTHVVPCKGSSVSQGAKCPVVLHGAAQRRERLFVHLKDDPGVKENVLFSGWHGLGNDGLDLPSVQDRHCAALELPVNSSSQAICRLEMRLHHQLVRSFPVMLQSLQRGLRQRIIEVHVALVLNGSLLACLDGR